MKIMILSDSHSVSKTDLLTLLKNNSVNYYIHCGDIYMTYDGINLNSFYLVRGNNDFGNIPDELFITIDDLKFYIVHGHRYDVDYNLDYLTHIWAGKLSNRLFNPTRSKTILTSKGFFDIWVANSTFSKAVRFWTKL